jgi:hypothetical protein
VLISSLKTGAEWEDVSDIVGSCEVDVDLKGKRAFCGVGEEDEVWPVAATDDRDRKWPREERPDDGREDGGWC